MKYLLFASVIYSFSIICTVSAATVQVAPAQGATLEISDAGTAWVTEQRRVSLPPGKHELLFEGLPSRLISGSSDLLSRGRDAGLTIQSRQYSPPAQTREDWLRALVGQRVRIEREPEAVDGILRAFSLDEQSAELDVMLENTAGKQWLKGVDQIRMPNSAPGLEPLLRWNVTVGDASPSALRLVYETGGLSWHASYTLITEPEAPTAILSARVGIRNDTDTLFPEARLVLMQTEQGQAVPLVRSSDASRSRRFLGPFSEPVFEQQMATPDARMQIDLPAALSLPARSEQFVSLLDLADIPVRMEYVYDGVLFDRYQRDQRNDWNYGTETHPDVDRILVMDALGRRGLDRSLPAGELKVLRRRTDGTVTPAGQARIEALGPDTAVRIRLGASDQLEGHRQRIGYTEITPLHEYEETFVITLMNHGEEKVPVRIREHLYRWSEYEIVKADTEYEEGEQQIEFAVELEPGENRQVEYTVRYRW